MLVPQLVYYKQRLNKHGFSSISWRVVQLGRMVALLKSRRTLLCLWFPLGCRCFLISCNTIYPFLRLFPMLLEAFPEIPCLYLSLKSKCFTYVFFQQAWSLKPYVEVFYSFWIDFCARGEMWLRFHSFICRNPASTICWQEHLFL